LELLRLSTSIIIAVFIGWNVLYIISARYKDISFLERLFLSYGIGLGSVSMEMLLFHLLGLKFDLVAMLIPWTALVLINITIHFAPTRKSDTVKMLKRKIRWNALAVFFVCGIAFEIGYAFLRALIRPMESYDAVAIYAIKSKIFYLAGSIPQNYFGNLSSFFPHPDYPLNIPLAETFVYLVMGNLNDELVKIIFPLYFTGILVLFYFAVRRFANARYALLFTFILATIPQFNNYAANAYVDLPLAYYYFASAIFLFRWLADRNRTGPLIISALMVALAGWTKNDGLMYCIINTCVILIFIMLNLKKITRKDIWRLLLYLSIIFLVSLPWSLAKGPAHIVNNEIDLKNLNPANLVKQFHKIVPIIYEYQKQFFGPKKWNIFWPAAFFIIIFNFRKALSGIGKYMALSISLAVLGYSLFYMISYVDVNFFLSKTWSRFLIHFLPVAVYWAAFTLKDDAAI